MCGIALVLSPHVLVVCQLRFLRKLLHVVGGAVAFLQHPGNVVEGVVALIRSGVEIPGFVDGPQVVWRNELLQTFTRRDRHAVAFRGAVNTPSTGTVLTR